MQAKLPDLNAALVTHRNAVLHAYDRNEFTKAAISFDAINSLLPDEYKVEINTEKYNQLIASKRTIKCDKCSEVFERGTIKPYKILLTNLESLMVGKRKVIVWDCLKCEHVRPLEGSQAELVIFKQPFYTKVIPEPPRRKGLHDRIGYTAKFKQWYDIAFREIESQIGLYRTEYASQQSAVLEAMPDE